MERGGSPDKKLRLKSKIWSTLPLEVGESVLPWLSHSDIARVRCVCKRWREVLTPPSLLRNSLYLEAVLGSRSPTCHYFEVFQIGQDDWAAASHDAVTDKWREVPVHNIKSEMAWIYDTCGPFVCCVSERGVHNRRNGPITNVSICNPFTQFWKDLPPLPSNMIYSSFKIVVDDLATSAYKVITAGWNYWGRLPRDTQIYSSITGCWKKTSSNPTSICSTGDWLHPCNGVIYTTHFTASRGHFAVDAFIIAEELWIKVRARLPELFQAGAGAQLLVCEPGRLLLVGGVGTTLRPHSLECMKVWEFEKKLCGRLEGGWVEIAEVPSRMFEEFLRRPSCFYGFKFVGVGTFVYIVCVAHGRLLVYDLVQQSWQEMNEVCPYDLHDAVGRGLSFYPSYLGEEDVR